jgi:hypothetical protein
MRRHPSYRLRSCALHDELTASGVTLHCRAARNSAAGEWGGCAALYLHLLSASGPTLAAASWTGVLPSLSCVTRAPASSNAAATPELPVDAA